MKDNCVIEHLQASRYVFWDFDGVIKDSVEVKSAAFEQLFLQFGNELAKRVRRHHEANGGMSRYVKLPLYLDWAGLQVSSRLIQEYSDKFSTLAKQGVIDSCWVPGVMDYFKANFTRQRFFLITATPQREIEDILVALDIKDYFERVIGAPLPKQDAINSIIDEYSIDASHAFMVGDARHDYEAAVINKVPFILRRTSLNRSLQGDLNCLMTDDFSYE